MKRYILSFVIVLSLFSTCYAEQTTLSNFISKEINPNDVVVQYQDIAVVDTSNIFIQSLIFNRNKSFSFPLPLLQVYKSETGTWGENILVGITTINNEFVLGVWRYVFNNSKEIQVCDDISDYILKWKLRKN